MYGSMRKCPARDWHAKTTLTENDELEKLGPRKKITGFCQTVHALQKKNHILVPSRVPLSY